MMISRISIPLLVAVLLSGQGNRPDFSGKWQVDKSRSTARTAFVNHPELSGPPAPVAPSGKEFDTMRPETIVHHEPALVITDEAWEGLPERTFKFSTDGKPNVDQLAGGGLHRASTRWDGNQLVTEWVLEQHGSAIMRGTDRRSLSSDGSTMIQERTVVTPKHESHLHIVWVRRGAR